MKPPDTEQITRDAMAGRLMIRETLAMFDEAERPPQVFVFAWYPCMGPIPPHADIVEHGPVPIVTMKW